jgi:hypothetical protein
VNTVVLITGYARAGKDTLGDAIASVNPVNSVKISFASLLKDRCDWFLNMNGLGGGKHDEFSFHNEKFKIQNRHFLESAGTLIRSINPEFFVNAVVAVCKQIESPNKSMNVIVSDWRYMNELRVIENELKGWRVIKLSINTAGVQPASESEARSVGEIIRNATFDREVWFVPDSASKIRSEGISIALSLGL